MGEWIFICFEARSDGGLVLEERGGEGGFMLPAVDA